MEDHNTQPIETTPRQPRKVLPVIIRMERRGKYWTPVAVFPTLQSDVYGHFFTVYTLQDSHCSASHTWYSETKKPDYSNPDTQRLIDAVKRIYEDDYYGDARQVRIYQKWHSWFKYEPMFKDEESQDEQS